MIPLIRRMFRFTRTIASEWQRRGTSRNRDMKNHGQCIRFFDRNQGTKQEKMGSICVAETTQRGTLLDEIL